MMLPTVLDVKDPFSLEVEVAFDVHMADFNIELVLFDAAGAETATDEDPADWAVVAKQTPLMNLSDNDDETFIRSIPRIHLKPHDEEGSGLKYMLTIEEKQAFYLFNEVSRSMNIDELCLPLIFKMQVLKEDSKNASGLSQLISKHEHAGAHTEADVFGEAHIIDYKIIAHS